MTPDERHLRAAEGYLELGLPFEAHEELECVERPLCSSVELLGVSVQVYQRLEKWDLMKVAAGELCRLRPDDPDWPMLLAYALRRCHGLGVAHEILAAALISFPEAATIRYNMACYEAPLGNLAAARMHLRKAVSLNPLFQRLALDDPDLQPLHGNK